ncbi:MAG: hypothetical protein IKU93_02780 [Alistipes sp.]|nr:hypothetical protein [Alistipes sp.]
MTYDQKDKQVILINGEITNYTNADIPHTKHPIRLLHNRVFNEEEWNKEIGPIDFEKAFGKKSALIHVLNFPKTFEEILEEDRNTKTTQEIIKEKWM